MPGIRDFTKDTFSPRVITTQAANYTVLSTDELIQINGAYTMTLPVLSTLQGTTYHKKAYRFTNIHATSVGTITAGTGNTIGGRASINLQPGESITIEGLEGNTDWAINAPFPLAPAIRNVVPIIVTTSGTTAQNAIDSSGCPVVGVVVQVVAWAQDTNAGNIIVKNATDTICTIAKSTTAGLPVGATTLTTPQMAVGDKLTVESDSTNGNARVVIYLSTQTLTNNG